MIYILLFTNVFVLYLYTLFPTVAAYRDAGEFATIGHILGVGHPPGYPLYTLLIYLFGRILPFGNFAYRINIFSAVVSSLTSVVILYFFVLVSNTLYKENVKKFTILVGYFLSLLFSLGYLQWYLSLVSEMYTLNTLFAILVILLCFLYYQYNKQFIYLLFFLFGLGLTNRLDIILFIPTIIMPFLEFVKLMDNKRFTAALVLVMLLLLGFSCYIYLPLRSACEPFIDWNNPEEPVRLLNSLLRKTHGSTLDLISVEYKSGENFFDGMKLYILHLLKNVSLVGVLIILLGIKETFKMNRKYALVLIFSWCLSCIYFIYKANMPPNPHAMAILEAHFLLPNIIVYTWLIFGMTKVIFKSYNFTMKLITVCCFVVLLCYNFFNNIARLNKRNNFYAYDYTINLFRSVPEKSIVIIKEDVQLFSCWYRKFVDKFRQGVHIIASGLSGSEWYQKMYKNFLKNLNDEIYITQINTEDNFLDFLNNNLNLNYRIFITPDVEPVVTKNLWLFTPFNLVIEVGARNKDIDVQNIRFFYDEIYIFRGRYVYDLNWEFFSSDLIEDYSKSLLNYGHEFLTKKVVFKEIEQIYKTSIYMNPILPFSYFDLGYIFFVQGKYEEAQQWYEIATEKFETYLNFAKKYKSSDDVKENIIRQTAVCWLHLGVVYERLNKISESIEAYNKSLEFNPYFADAYYNLACIYWREQEWDKVRYYLSKVLRLNPQHEEAKYYLQKIPQ